MPASRSDWAGTPPIGRSESQRDVNLLVESRTFYPAIGGIETLTRELARQWHALGHPTRVVTRTSLHGEEELEEICVHRQPALFRLLQLFRWADLFVQSGISLRSLSWPFLLRTPVVIMHHNMLWPGRGPSVRTRIKRWATRLAENVAVSRAVASAVPAPSRRIPNTFRSIFDQPEAPEEGREGLLFVGRLVSDKGADVALEALSRLRRSGVERSLTVCGEGPERVALERQARELGVEDLVQFTGWMGPNELADLYRGAEVTVVPSRYEPFGIVALEAVASRCPVVGSDTGGLPEAVGRCGILVEPDDPAALASGIEEALRPARRETLREAMPGHVSRHRAERIAREYVALFEEVLDRAR